MNWLESIELDEIEVITATDETTEERNERFKITDLASLNWVLRKLSALDKKYNEDLLLFHAEIDRIDGWFSKQTKDIGNSKRFFEGLIGQYAKEQIATDPKWKGNKTPYGKVNFHKQKDQWEYDDEALVTYLEGEKKTALLKVKLEPIKELIKDYYTLKNGRLINESTGEVVPGVIVTEREPKLSIRLEG